jgi:predicted amidohydrolase YtcJ
MGTTQHLLLDGRFVDPPVSSVGSTARPIGEAMLIRDGRIAAVGAVEQVRAAVRGSCDQTRLDGRVVIPGLVDSHCHIDAIGAARHMVDLGGTTSKRQCLDRVRQAASVAPGGQPLVGHGFNVNIWNPPAFPTAADLDAACADRPVLLAQFDGHGLWVNTRAMRDSGIDAAAPTPEGGSLTRDAEGRPAGMFFEKAIALIRRPQPTAEQHGRDLAEGIGVLARFGYTAAHLMAAGSCAEVTDSVTRLHDMHGDGSCPLRVRGYVLHTHFDAAITSRQRWPDDPRFRVVGIKAFADGSLNSRTAWMLDAFADEPGNRGVAVLDRTPLHELVRRCELADLPLACHAIGDRAVRELLDAFEAHRPLKPHRRLAHRIEHAQHLHPDDVPRFARLGVAASMQTCHLLPDWRTADRLLGPRSRWTYAVASLLDAGATVALGSDAPVVSADPRDSLLGAVLRSDHGGQPVGGWHPAERVSVHQWLWMHTVAPWLAVGEAGQRGRLTAGMDADLTFLDNDIFDPGFSDGGSAAPLNVRIAGAMVAGTFTHRAF